MKKIPHAMLAGSILVIAALSSGAAIAGGAIVYEVGTEDVGLAAAGYAARAQDATTVFTNPAGMTRLEGQPVEVGSQLLYSNLKFSIGKDTAAALGTGDGGTAVGKGGWLPGGGFFYSYSVSPDLKLGFAQTGSFGAALKYDDNWVGRYYVQQAAVVGLSFLPSIAYRVNDKLSVGASINAMFGYLKSVTAINNIVGPDGKVKIRDTKWGWGANVGLLYEATPGTRFGLTYSSPVKLNFSAPAQFESIAPGLNALLAARGLLNAQIDIGLTVPQQMMGSVFHTVNDRWAVLGNVGWQQWSKFGQVELGVDSSNPTSLTTSIPFKDTRHGALGAQYRLSEPWRLNFGVAYDSAFQPGPNFSPLLPANAAWRFGVGGQNQVSKTFNWGVAFEYLSGGTLGVDKRSIAPVVLGGRGDLVGSYNNIGSYFLSANFNWKF
jgi:long-chain fatty acid transport protein